MRVPILEGDVDGFERPVETDGETDAYLGIDV